MRPLVAVAVTAVVATAGAQPSPGPATTWPARLQPAAREALVALGDSARAARLPVEPLYAKAAEGALKGADDARIVAAVRKLAHELEAARAALGAGGSPDEVLAGATALRLGVDLDALRRLAAANAAANAARGASAAPLTVPLGVVSNLVTRGVPADVAMATVGRLVARGVSAAEYVALSDAVDRDILAGVSPQAAAIARGRSIARP